MLLKLLKTGREDISVDVLNTSLCKGLAQVINDIIDGACVDAVVSSIPGSNYTYEQITSLFYEKVPMNPKNIVFYRSALRSLLRNIAFNGFPSVDWLEGIDVNSVKLRNDARMFVFIEALGTFNVPVILPYGNLDSTYKGNIKSINLLSLASNAKVYSALDQEGKRVDGYPYSPLGSGDETAVYDILECPDPEDPYKANLDINNDGYQDYAYIRTGKIAYHDEQGNLSFAPPLLSKKEFSKLMMQLENSSTCLIDKEVLLTARQYKKLKDICPEAHHLNVTKSYVWLNSPKHGKIYVFDSHCWSRGKLRGTSLIPPNKLRELLPPKNYQTHISLKAES
jgi:hypothetical protein